MQNRLVVLFALCLCAATAARAQSRGATVGDYQSSREESAPVPPPAPAAAAPGIATGDDVDLVSPSAAKKERARVAEAMARAEAEARAQAEAKARAEADAKAKADAEAKAKLEAEAKLAAETRARAEADAKLAAETRARAEADAKARAEADAKARAEAETHARVAVKSDADAKAQLEADAKAAAFLSGDARPGAPSAAAPVVAAPVVATPAAAPAAPAAPPCLDTAKAKRGKKKKAASTPCLVQQLPLPSDPAPAARAGADDDVGLVDAPRRVVLVGGSAATPLAEKSAPAPAPAASAPVASPAAAAPAPVAAARAAPPAAVAPVPAALAAAQAPAASSTLVVPSAATRNDPPPARVARADLGSTPAAYDSRSGSSSSLAPATGALMARDEPTRRAAHAVVHDGLLIGPVGLKTNDLGVDVDVGEKVQAQLGWRFAVDDATANHHTLMLGLRGSRCDEGAICPGAAWYLRGSYSPGAQAEYGVDRVVAGHVQTQADRLGWSGALGGAGLGYRTLGGFLVGGDAQLDALSLDYTRNSRGIVAATSSKLTQLRLRGELGWARGGFSATASFAGYAYLGDSPDTTHSMPLRGALIDDGIAGLASAPQSLLAKASAGYEFSFGLSAAASYGYLQYAGLDWSNAQVISFKLQQRISRFDLGVGVGFMLDNPAQMPVGATASDYATTYATASAGASF